MEEEDNRGEGADDDNTPTRWVREGGEGKK